MLALVHLSGPHRSLAVDMLSDLSFSTLPFDISVLPDTRPPPPEEDPHTPLNFDDLLDIAREFEFTRTITHIWPFEEEHGTCTETRLDDIYAAIAPSAADAEECPISLPSSTVNPVHVQEVDTHRPASVGHVSDPNASTFADTASFPKDEDQVPTDTSLPIVSILQGWTPPNGSQFLDLNDGLLLPQPEEDTWNLPRPKISLSTSPTQPVDGKNQPFATDSTIDDAQLRISTTLLKLPSVGTTDKTVDASGKKGIPVLVQSSKRAILEPVWARSAVQTASNVPNRAIAAPHAKAPKSRPHRPSTLATGGTTTANYARAPRGGIPPHIARSVTKANILRIEKERKVMQDAFSTTTAGETKKPSVLRRTAKVVREPSKMVNGGGNRKELSHRGESDEKEGRTAKRARV